MADQKDADRSKNASATSAAGKDGDKASAPKQIGVVRKKKDKSKEDESEDEALRKLKAGSALSISKTSGAGQLDLSSYVTFK